MKEIEEWSDSELAEQIEEWGKLLERTDRLVGRAINRFRAHTAAQYEAYRAERTRRL